MLLMDIGSTKTRWVRPNFSELHAKVLAFWKGFVAHSIGFVALACVILSVFAVYIATTDKIVVGPFSVPDEYQERGYTSEAVSNAIVQFIHGNESTVTLTQSFQMDPATQSGALAGADEVEGIGDHVDGKHVVSSFDQSSIPDIHVPMTSLSLDSMVEILRETVGRRPTRIVGEIVALKEADSSTGEPDLQHAQVRIRYTIEYPEPAAPILGFHWWPRRTTTITDTLTANGAEEVVRKLALVTADGLGRRTLPDEDDQDRRERYINRGNTYFGLGDYEHAERMYVRANDFQESGHAFLCLGVIEQHKGNFDEAETYFADATTTQHNTDDDDVNWAFLYWGNLLLREHKLEDARSKYLVVTQAPSTFHSLLAQASAFHNMGFIDLSEHKQDQARQAFKYAREFAGRLRDKAQTCAYNGGIKSACDGGDSAPGNEAEAFLSIAQANRLLARVHYGQAQLLAAQNAARQSLKTEYEAATQSDDSYSRAHYRLARIYLDRKNYAQAQNELQKTIQLEPTFEPAYADWQIVVAKWKTLPGKQRSDKPRKRSLALAYKNRGDMFARAGNPDEAYEKYCLAADLDPAYKSLCTQQLIGQR